MGDVRTVGRILLEFVKYPVLYLETSVASDRRALDGNLVRHLENDAETTAPPKVGTLSPE